MTRDLVVSLLNHIHSFSDWAQCFVLDIVGDYSPASEEERFDILEVRRSDDVWQGVWRAGRWEGGDERPHPPAAARRMPLKTRRPLFDNPPQGPCLKLLPQI